MRKAAIFSTIIFLLASGFILLTSSFQEQQDKPDPWKPEQLIKPAELAKILNTPKAKKPVIINVGPEKLVKTAIGLGEKPASTPEGLEVFKKEIAKHKKSTEVVIYCGCCTMKNCPNIRPAWEYLQKSGYKKSKLLDIPTSLHEDWVSKGYPVE